MLFGGEIPLISVEALKMAKEVWRGRLRGIKQQNLFLYEKRLEGLTFPYLCVLPGNSTYTADDFIPAMNANMEAFPFFVRKKTAESSSPKEGVLFIREKVFFEVRGSILDNRVLLSWFFDGFEKEEFLVYRLTQIPTDVLLRRISPLGRVKATFYEDMPPVGGPYYYVVVQEGEEVRLGKNVFGPVWFPLSSSPPGMKIEEQ